MRSSFSPARFISRHPPSKQTLQPLIWLARRWSRTTSSKRGAELLSGPGRKKQNERSIGQAWKDYHILTRAERRLAGARNRSEGLGFNMCSAVRNYFNDF